MRDRFGAEVRDWSGTRVGRRPDAGVRARIERLLPALDAPLRERIAFVLRTATG